MEGDEGVNKKNYKEETDFIFKEENIQKLRDTENT